MQQQIPNIYDHITDQLLINLEIGNRWVDVSGIVILHSVRLIKYLLKQHFK